MANSTQFDFALEMDLLRQQETQWLGRATADLVKPDEVKRRAISMLDSLGVSWLLLAHCWL
jgi:hypothetical protein